MDEYGKGMDDRMENRTFPRTAAAMNGLDLEVLTMGYLRGDAAWRYFSIDSPFNRLYLIRSGEARIVGPLGDTPMRAGRAYLVPAGGTFDYICDRAFEKAYFHFRLEHFYGLDAFRDAPGCLELPMERSEIDLAVERAERGALADAVACSSLVLALSARFLEQMGEPDREPEVAAYRGLGPYLKRKLSARLGPDDLAAALGMETARFEREFKARMGMTPTAYIKGHLERRAKELLASSDLSVKEIAGELGFRDEFYFSRFFKRRAALPPSAYRKEHRFF